MQFSALASMFFLIKRRETHTIFNDKHFWFIIILSLLIFIRPNNVFKDYKQLSYLLLGLIIGLTSRLFFPKIFYVLNLIFPLGLLFNIIHILYKNPTLSLTDPYNVIYDNKNIFGYFLATATISIFASIPKFTHQLSRIMLFLFSTCFFIMGLLNGMRSGTIGVVLAFLSLFFWKSRKDFLLYLCILLITALALFPFIPRWHFQRYVSLKTIDDYSYTGRLTIWKGAIEQIKKSPLWGEGHWQFSPTVGGSHNFFLDIWIKYGLLLGTLLQLYLLSIVFYSIRKKDVWSVTILVALLTINQVESYLVTSWCASYFYYIMGTGLANRYKVQKDDKNQAILAIQT